MNDAQRLELEKLRDEQTLLAGRMARLESRLRSFEADLAAQPSPPLTAKPLPPPLPPPTLPVPVPPPVPVASPVASAPPLPPLPVAEATAATGAAPKESLEVRIGTTWLVRVGVVLLLTSLAFLGSYLYKKIALMYLGAGALTGVGAWLERGKEAARSPRMLNFARVVLAGGLSAIYYVTYAAHWNPNLLVLRDPLLDGTLLLAWTGFLVWLADRRGSEVLATFAILLAYYTSAINEKAAFTLFSNLSLAVAAVFLLRRHLWRVFPFASVAATYGSYWFWSFFQALVRRRIEGAGPSHALAGTGGMWIEGGFLLIYWMLFTATAFVPGATGWPARRRAWFVSVNNLAFFSLTTWLLLGEFPGSFWKWSLGFGAVLCVLSEGCRWVRPRLDAETESAYLLQGLLLITLGFFAYFDGWQLGLILAVQSVVLLGRAQVREERLPLWASLASAVAAFVVAANQLADWQAPVPAVSAAGAGGLLIFAAWWSQRCFNRRSPAPTAPEPAALPGFHETLRPAPGFYALLGCADWLWTVERTFAHHVALVPVLAGAGVLLTASVYALRVRAVPFYGQAFLLAAFLHRFAEDAFAGPAGPAAPTWSLATLLLATLVTGHWWQARWPWTDGRLRPSRNLAAVFAGGNAALAVLLLCDWLRAGLGGPMADGWAAVAAALSLVVLGYGIRTGYRPLAVAGQALLAVSIAACVGVVWTSPWTGGLGREAFLTLVPLAALLATAHVVRRYFATDANRAPVLAWRVMCEIVATLFLLTWGSRYVAEAGRFTFFAAAGAAVLVWAQVRREPRHCWWSAVLSLAGAVSLLLLARQDRAALPHLLGIAALAGQQQFVRYWSRREPESANTVPAPWQAALMIGATLSAWTVLNAWMATSFGGAFTIAASWSLFAAAVFTFGLLRHEKIYRWLGLTILVCTLGRIAIVDIWQLDSLGRAVSALCLGVVLLGIGYLYNRFHAKWHDLF